MRPLSSRQNWVSRPSPSATTGPAGCGFRKRRAASSNVATRTACHLAPREASEKSYWSRLATSMASGSSSREAPVHAAAARRPRFHSSVSGTPDRSTGIGSILAMVTTPLSLGHRGGTAPPGCVPGMLGTKGIPGSLGAVRVLVVEDERRLAAAVRRGLAAEGFAVDIVYDGEDGLHSAREGDYDAVVLDLMLPKVS